MMTEHTITVGGQRYKFEAHLYPTGDKMSIAAPGVAPFDVGSLDEARDILRSLYARRATE